MGVVEEGGQGGQGGEEIETVPLLNVFMHNKLHKQLLVGFMKYL